MKRISISFFFLIVILLSACSNPGSGDEIIPPEVDKNQGDFIAAPTASPIPTPSPTPIPEVRITLAEKSFFEGDYQAALKELDLAVTNSNDPGIHALADIRKAQIFINQGLFNDAVNLLKPLLDNDAIENRTKAKANYFYGVSQENLNNPIEAAKGFNAFNHYLPGYLDLFMFEKAGDVLFASQMYDQALVNYTQAVENSSNLDTTYIKIKIGKIYSAQLDFTNAIRVFMDVHDSSPNDFVRAQTNLLAGQAYLAMGLPEQAYARFQESVQNFPRAYDTHSGLAALVEAGIPVDEFNRGLSNYYVGNYGLAVNAFLRYIDQNPENNGNAYYFIGHSYLEMDDPENAIIYWTYLVKNYPDNIFFADAWEDIAYTQWAYLDQYSKGAQTLIDYSNLYPGTTAAAEAIFEAGKIYERNNQLTDATRTWSQLIDTYPQFEISYKGLFQSAITNYRLSKYEQALSELQRYSLLSVESEEKSKALFWIGKSYEKLGENEKAISSWRECSLQDPTGYYSERAKEKLINAPLFTPSLEVNKKINMEQDRLIAEVWMRKTFNLPQDTNFITLTPFYENPNYKRAEAYWDLGLFQEARNEYEALRLQYNEDPTNLFRLANHFVEMGLYRSAILTSRQILELANLNDLSSLDAPLWFNHIRFGMYFEEIVYEAAEDYQFDPLLLFSLIRQESFFEGFIISSAGAKGLMQLMPATGKEVSDLLKWPKNYQESDLYLPAINIRLGASYLARMRTYFQGDIFAALAAYNAGPGNVLKWEGKASNDPDLFLEIIPYEETQRYLKNIYTFYRIYENLYSKKTAE